MFFVSVTFSCLFKVWHFLLLLVMCNFRFVYKSERTVISKFKKHIVVVRVNTIKKSLIIEVTSYNRVFWSNFQFVNLIQLCLKVKGASYNRKTYGNFNLSSQQLVPNYFLYPSKSSDAHLWEILAEFQTGSFSTLSWKRDFLMMPGKPWWILHSLGKVG